MGIALKVEAAVAAAQASETYITTYVEWLKINPFAYAGDGREFKPIYDFMNETTDVASLHVSPVYADAAGTSDNFSKLLTIGRTFNDTLATPTDSASIQYIIQRTFADTLAAPTDSALVAAFFPRTLADTVSAPTDSAVVATFFPRTAADTLDAPTDSASLVVSYPRTVADTLAAPTDNVSVSASFARTVPDSVSTSETLQIVWTRVSVLSGSVNGSLANELMLNSGGTRTTVTTYNY